MIRVLDAREMRIDSEDDVALVRHQVRERAAARGFDPFATAAITTATSELSRNVFVHARRGRAVIEEITNGLRIGLRISFEDEGPGIADLPRALAGGYSTRRSMGLGLSGSRKLVDEFDIDSGPGRGTKVTIVKWARLS